jgi:ABC-2 type transport system permease protein
VTSALRYEWVRLRTIRSTWVLSLFSVLLSGLVAFLVAKSTDHVGLSDYANVLIGGAPFISLFMALVGVYAYGHEYRHGTIRATLTAVPQRASVFLAKMFVVVSWSVLVAAVSIGMAWAVGTLTLGNKAPDLSLSDSPLPRVLLGALLVVVVWALVGLGYAGLFRNVPASIVVLLVLPLIVEPLLETLLSTDFMEPVKAVARFLPFTVAHAVTAVDRFELPTGAHILPWQGAATFGGFAVLVLALASVLFAKRDA